jgi:hypothetical protein
MKQPFYATQKAHNMTEDTRKNKTMFYVDAHKGGITIHLPCWGSDNITQKEEAENLIQTLKRAGWTGPVKELKDDMPKYHAEPKMRKKVIEPKHPHWRVFLEDAK